MRHTGLGKVRAMGDKVGGKCVLESLEVAKVGGGVLYTHSFKEDPIVARRVMR